MAAKLLLEQKLIALPLLKHKQKVFSQWLRNFVCELFKSSFGMGFNELHKLENTVYSPIILSTSNDKKYPCQTLTSSSIK